MTETCAVKGCDYDVSPNVLLCTSHWLKVPKATKRRVYQNYRSGQDRGGRPTADWLNAAAKAVDAATRSTLPTLDNPCPRSGRRWPRGRQLVGGVGTCPTCQRSVRPTMEDPTAPRFPAHSAPHRGVQNDLFG